MTTSPQSAVDQCIDRFDRAITARFAKTEARLIRWMIGSTCFMVVSVIAAFKFLS